jgi:hypothetical protein
VKDCAWNPVIPTLVAVCLSDGSLVAVEINNTQFTINSLPSSTGAQYVNILFLYVCYFLNFIELLGQSVGVPKENS